MTFAKIHEAQQRLAQGAKPLGSLLWWSLDGNRVAHDRLEELAQRHGLDTKYLPTALKPVQSFRRACRHAATKMPKGMLLRPIGESADEIAVGIVNERPDAIARDLDYDVVCRITFNKHSNVVGYDQENALVWELQQLYRHHQEHTTEDIRGMLSSFLGEAGVSLRDSGGVYFVPGAYQATLEALCAVVEAVGQNQTFTLPIVETAETKAVLREVAKSSLDDEIRQLHEQLQRFDQEKVRDSTLEKKLATFEELRSRVNLFARVLSFKADSLNNKISGIQAGLRRQLAGDTPGVPLRAAPSEVPQTEAAARQVAANDVGF